MTRFNSNYPPLKLMTDADGDNARLRVDVGQTGFFDGREFLALAQAWLMSVALLLEHTIL